MKFAAGLLMGFCLGWILANQFPDGLNATILHLRNAVQNAMPWT